MPVKELVLEPGVNVGAKTVTKSRTRKTKSAKSGVKASKADKVSNVPAQFVLPKIETRYWFCFYTGLLFCLLAYFQITVVLLQVMRVQVFSHIYFQL